MVALATLIGFISGLAGTGLGGLIAAITPGPSRETLSALLGFASGIMLAVVAFDLIPEAATRGGLPLTLFALALGLVLLNALENLLPEEDDLLVAGKDMRHYLRTGILVALSIAFHDLAEGLAIGSGYMAEESVGMHVAIVMTLHNIPEGMAIAGPLRLGRARRGTILLASILAGTPTGLGALAGALLGELSPSFLTFCLGCAGGAMTAVVARRLLPDSLSLKVAPWCLFGVILGVVTGLLLTLEFGPLG